MWNNIVIEGFCLGEFRDGKYPCGMSYPTAFCLGNGQCPHFVYSESNEREAAFFVPFHLILKDKLEDLFSEIYSNIRWWVWDSLWFNRRKAEKFFNSIGSTKPGEFPKIDNMYKKARDKFPKWLKKASKEV